LFDRCHVGGRSAFVALRGQVIGLEEEPRIAPAQGPDAGLSERPRVDGGMCTAGIMAPVVLNRKPPQRGFGARFTITIHHGG